MGMLETLKQSFSRHSFSNLSKEEYIRNALEVFIVPSIVCSFLGFMVLLSNETRDQIFINAINEFKQITGLKLSLYFSIMTAGFGFLSMRIGFLCRIFAWITASIAKLGFTIAGVLAAVLFGIAFPATAEKWNFALGAGLIILSGFHFVVQFLFYSLAKIVVTEQKDVNVMTFWEKLIYKFEPFCGAIMLSLSVYGLYVEPWQEVFSP